MKKITLLIFTLILSEILMAQTTQDVLGTSGSLAIGGGGSLSYTIGQVGYSIATNSIGSLGAGFQQSYEISSTAGLDETNFSLEAKVYPNPTTNFLMLSIKDLNETYIYQIVDFSGKTIANGKLKSPQTQLDFGSYVGGSYYIKISINKKNIKTYHVIKHQ